jgi:hypothetical protein
LSSAASIARSATTSTHTSKWSLDEDILPEIPSPPLRPVRAPTPPRAAHVRPERPKVTIDTISIHPLAPRTSSDSLKDGDQAASPVSPEDKDADASFAESALSYIGSPTARQALGRTLSPTSPTPTLPPGIYSPTRTAATIPFNPDLPIFHLTPYSPPVSPSPEPPRAPNSAHTAGGNALGPIAANPLLQVRKGSEGEASLLAGSITDSILAPANWPLPPTTPPTPPAVPMSPVRRMPKRSRSGTVGLGVVPQQGYTRRV